MTRDYGTEQRERARLDCPLLQDCLETRDIRLFPSFIKFAKTMPLRRRAHRRTSYNDPTDDNERLLSSIELQDYKYDAVTDASLGIYSSSQFHTSFLEEKTQFNYHEILPRKPLRRVAVSLKLRRCLDALKRCAKVHLGGQLVIVEVDHEPENCGQIHSSPRMSSREWKRKGYSCGGPKLKSDSDDGLRSTIKWYFWSPSNTVKNCPTLEFVRTRLAPPVVWL